MGRRVLIVDDSPVMRTFIRRTIQICGLDIGQFVEADNGARALEALSRHGVDLILTDVNMPVMDGPQLLRRLRAEARYEGIPVIVVSTDATQYRLEEMFSLGAVGYVSKPFVPERLRTVLTEVLASGEAAE